MRLLFVFVYYFTSETTTELGDEGFALQTYVTRPFQTPPIAKDARMKKFIQQLGRARRVVENAFWILAQKWPVFLGV
jgi:hypothetical protein